MTNKIEKPFLSFERALIDDIDILWELEQELFPGFWTKKELIEVLNDPDEYGEIYYTKHNIENKIIGFCIFGVFPSSSTDKDTRGYISRIGTTSFFQRQGVGEYMLEHILIILKRKGALTCDLDVHPSNIAAQELYKKHGFEYHSIRPNYYLSDEDGYIYEIEF